MSRSTETLAETGWLQWSKNVNTLERYAKDAVQVAEKERSSSGRDNSTRMHACFVWAGVCALYIPKMNVYNTAPCVSRSSVLSRTHATETRNMRT